MSALSDKVLAMSKPYFGPAAERFLTRACKSHLNIELTALALPHLKELAHWIRVGGGLIMDPAKAAEISQKVAALGG